MNDAKLITVREPKIPSATEYEDVSYTFAELRETWPKGDESVVGKLLDLVELQSAREKYWHDHILAASGGHATTPEGAAEVIRQLRGDLDRMKAIVDALPKTKDGVPIVPGMDLYPNPCPYPILEAHAEMKAYWITNEGQHICDDTDLEAYGPVTHWMPLPKPPVKEGGEG